MKKRTLINVRSERRNFPLNNIDRSSSYLHPYLSANLVTALAGLNVNDFPHTCRLKKEKFFGKR